jgi:hypothetical protein
VVAVGPVPAVGPVAPLEPVGPVAPPPEAAGAVAGAMTSAAISARSLIDVRARTLAKDSWAQRADPPANLHASARSTTGSATGGASSGD